MKNSFEINGFVAATAEVRTFTNLLSFLSLYHEKKILVTAHLVSAHLSGVKCGVRTVSQIHSTCL